MCSRIGNLMYERGYETIDAGTCNRDPLQNASLDNNLGTSGILLENPDKTQICLFINVYLKNRF
jgi:hypothetical protein